MDVRHCPRCGSDDISKNYGSAEYSSRTRFSCNCGWGYKDGRGIGTASRSNGTHPRNATTNKQHKLDGDFNADTAGQWCSTCDTCARPGYCGCVEEDQTGFCKKCADYSEHDVDEMVEVCTYFGRHNYENKFPCSICGEKKSEYKVV